MKKAVDHMLWCLNYFSLQPWATALETAPGSIHSRRRCPTNFSLSSVWSQRQTEVYRTCRSM